MDGVLGPVGRRGFAPAPAAAAFGNAGAAPGTPGTAAGKAGATPGAAVVEPGAGIRTRVFAFVAGTLVPNRPKFAEREKSEFVGSVAFVGRVAAPGGGGNCAFTVAVAARSHSAKHFFKTVFIFSSVCWTSPRLSSQRRSLAVLQYLSSAGSPSRLRWGLHYSSPVWRR